MTPIHSQRVMIETMMHDIDYEQEYQDHCDGNFDLRTAHCTCNTKERDFKEDGGRYGQKNLRRRLIPSLGDRNIEPVINYLFPEVTLGMPQKALIGTLTGIAKGGIGEAFVGEFDFRKWCGHQREENNSHNRKWDSWFGTTCYTMIRKAYHNVLYTSAEPDIVPSCYRLPKEERRKIRDMHEKKQTVEVERLCKSVYDEAVERRDWYALSSQDERDTWMASIDEPIPFLGYQAAVEGESQSLWGGNTCVSIVSDALKEPNVRTSTAVAGDNCDQLYDVLPPA